MANDGSIAFDSRINTDNLNRDLSEMEEAIADAATASEKKAEAAFKNMEKQAKRLAKAYEDAGMDASEAMQKAWKDVQANADAFGTNATENFKNVGAAAEDAGASVESLSGKLQSALAAAGLAYGAKEITDVGISYEKAMNQVAISTGAAGQELENLQGIASNVYADNFGESMEDAAASVAEVYKRTGLVGEELQKATEGAYTLQNAFGYEVNDSLQAATQLMNTFGISAEEAYTLIAQGAQKGLDQNGDMLDTLNEYSVQFANLGYSAEDMFNMLANGVQNGTWSVDKLGDAVKEMNIRLNSGDADEALQALGLGFADSATNAAALKQAALDVSKADVELQKAQQNVNDTLAKSGSASVEYQDALNKAEQAQINLEKAQAEYNKTSSETTYNLDEIKGKLAAGGSDAQEAIQDIMTALSQVEDEQDRYVLGQTLMGTQWEDIGESAVQALMNTQGEISTTSDAMDQLSDLQFDDLGSQFEKLKRQIETEVVLPIAQKYMPKIEKAIDYVSEHLDEIVEHAKPIAAAIVAAFAMKKITDFGNSVVTTVKTVKTAFSALNASNPLGWITIGVSALAGLAGALKNYHSQQSKAAQVALDNVYKISDKVKDSAEKSKEELESFYQSIENNQVNFVAGEQDFANIQELKSRLNELVNSDGTVKAGYEEEVKGILEQINAYADTSYSVLDGVIAKNGEVITNFKEASAELDNLIEKQRVQSALNATEEEYTTAVTNLPQEITKLADARAEYAKANETYQKLLVDYDKWQLNHTGKYVSEEEVSAAFGAVSEAKQAVDDLSATVDAYSTVVDKYESASQKIKNGDYSSAFKELQSIYSEPIKTDEAGASLDELMQQYEEKSNRFREITEMMQEGMKIDDSTFEQAKEDYVNATIELGKILGDGGEISGKDFAEALRNSDIPLGEAIAYLKEFTSTKVDELTESFDKKDKLHDEGVENGDYWVDGLVSSMTSTENYNRLMAAAQSLADSVPSTTRHLWGINSPSKVAMGISEYWGEGLTIGMEKEIPDVSAVSADMANTAVSSTLGIMNTQGAAAVSAYSPILQQAYAVPAAASTSTVISSNSQPQGDIIIPVSIGDEILETVVVNTITRANASSGGWSV